jgi:two-component system, OmpR family, response regulator
MSERVLVVEDDFELRQFLELWLTQSHYRVVSAADAFEALALVETHDFDAAICDIALPGMDGLSLVEIFNQQGRCFPVIVYSAVLTPEIAHRAHELGVCDILAKPSPLPVIAAKLAMALGEREADARS